MSAHVQTPLRLHLGAACLSRHCPAWQTLPHPLSAGEKSAITRAVNEGRDLKFLVRNDRKGATLQQATMRTRLHVGALPPPRCARQQACTPPHV